jgi:hypothetical protein
LGECSEGLQRQVYHEIAGKLNYSPPAVVKRGPLPGTQAQLATMPLAPPVPRRSTQRGWYYLLSVLVISLVALTAVFVPSLHLGQAVSPQSVSGVAPLQQAQPAASMDLETLLVRSGDLPSYVHAGQVSDFLSTVEGAPRPDQQISQRLEFQFENTSVLGLDPEHRAATEHPGSVTVRLYRQPDLARAAFERAASNLSHTLKHAKGLPSEGSVFGVNNIGDQSTGRVGSVSVQPLTVPPPDGAVAVPPHVYYYAYPQVLFVRCRALISIEMRDEPETVVTYARRLDHRLVPVVCR